MEFQTVMMAAMNRAVVSGIDTCLLCELKSSGILTAADCQTFNISRIVTLLFDSCSLPQTLILHASNIVTFIPYPF